MRIIPTPNVGSSTRNILFVALLVPLTLIPSFTNAATSTTTPAPTLPTTPAPPPPIDAISIPVDVGDIKGAKAKESFGTFPKQFATCGQTTGVALNSAVVALGANRNAEIRVHCVPEPGYVIVGEEDRTLDALTEKSLINQCEGIIACGATDYKAGTDSSDEVNDHRTANTRTHYKLPVRQNSICENKALSKTGKIFIANENNCMYSGKHKTFLDGIKGRSVSGKFHILPRFIGTNNQFNLGHRHIYRTEITPQAYDSQLVLGFPNEEANALKEFKPCNGACTKGKTLKFAFKTGSWRAIVYLKKTCPSFRVCINPENFGNNVLSTCKLGSQWDILVHGGSVVWPGRIGGAVIKMKPDFTNAEAADSGPVAVEIGYGVQVGAQTEAELFVGNMYREFVMSDSQGFKEADAAHISMHFPAEDCLEVNGGVSSDNIRDGQTYVAKTETIQQAFSPTSAEGIAINGKQNQQDVQAVTKAAPIIKPATSTALPPKPVQTQYASGTEAMIHDSDEQVYDSGDWWIWGLYIGSILGTVVIMLPGTALFYVLRRTVFATWYRGMYKRYGCDASGTTGGITGVGFSDTTTGGITVGGTTGGGTTGGGTTMGGDTTGGDTTKTNTLAL